MLDSGGRRVDAVGMVMIGMLGMTEKSRVGGLGMAREAVGEERDNAAMHEGRVVVPHQQLFFALGGACPETDGVSNRCWRIRAPKG